MLTCPRHSHWDNGLLAIFHPLFLPVRTFSRFNGRTKRSRPRLLPSGPLPTSSVPVLPSQPNPSTLAGLKPVPPNSTPSTLLSASFGRAFPTTPVESVDGDIKRRYAGGCAGCQCCNPRSCKPIKTEELDDSRPKFSHRTEAADSCYTGST